MRLPLLFLARGGGSGSRVGIGEGEPARVVAEGVHQQIGPCHVPDKDLSNYPRFKFLCPADFEEDYSFDCTAAKDQRLRRLKEPSWYIMCGKAHTDRALYVGVVAALGAAASLAMGLLLLLPPAPGGSKAKRA